MSVDNILHFACHEKGQSFPIVSTRPTVLLVRHWTFRPNMSKFFINLTRPDTHVVSCLCESVNFVFLELQQSCSLVLLSFEWLLCKVWLKRGSLPETRLAPYLFWLLFVWLQICVAIAGYLLTVHSFRAYFYLLCFFAPFFNDSFTVPQCAAASGGPEHVFYYHFCGSFTVCAKVCVRVRSSVCVCVCVKGHKKFWAFCSSILISICFWSALSSCFPRYSSWTSFASFFSFILFARISDI